MPESNMWLVGVFTLVCVVFSSLVIGGGTALIDPFAQSTAASLGILPLIIALCYGTIKFGFDILDTITTMIWNKVLDDNQLPVWHKVKAMARMSQAYHKMIYEVKYGPNEKLAKKVMKRYYALRKQWKEKHLKEDR